MWNLFVKSVFLCIKVWQRIIGKNIPKFEIWHFSGNNILRPIAGCVKWTIDLVAKLISVKFN